MKPAPKHPRENERLASLKGLNILDTLPEEAFDEITMLASQICQSPIALVSLIDESRQWFKSKYGLAANETPRDFAFCAHAILGEDVFTVPDAMKDERFKDNPLVTGDPKVMFYAGAPLLSPDGHAIGTLCVIDHKPKKLSDDQNKSLRALSKQVGRLLQLRTQLAEQQRINLELEFKKVAVENLSEGVVLQGTDYRIVEFNQAALETLGLSADQLTGKTSLDPDWQAIKEDGSPFPGIEHPAVLALQTGERQRSVVMGISTPKADLRWILINSTPVFLNQTKKPSYSVTSFSNITTQKNAKSLIEKKEADLTRVLNGVPAMIGHWKSDLTNIHANTAYTSYFGKTPEQIKGQPIQDLLGPDLFRINFPYIEKVLQGQAQTFQRDMTTADGNVRNVLATYLPEIEKKNVIGFFVIITDLTEIKRLENERELLAAKMIDSAKLSTLGEMAGGIAHEVNTPLAVITTKTGQLLESFEQGTPPREEAILQLQKIKVTAERIAKIVKGLRQFSRNSEKDPKERVLISHIIESTLDLCHEKIAHTGIRLTTDIKESLFVEARATELSQVLLNLISNSIDAIENLSEKWIKILVTQSDNKAIIAISDNGDGIPDEIFDKIMNPFFTTKEVGKGTGLGLSISNGIVASHGGKLYLDRESKNTCFVIELPLLRSLQ